MLVGAPYELLANTAEDVRQRNAASNAQRSVERFSTKSAHDGDVVIVGGGPSLADLVDEVIARKQNGQHVWATNNTYAFLVEHGIQPDAHVILDSRPENAAFLYPHPDVTYYLNVSCDPSLFEKLAMCRVVMYDLSSSATGYTVGIKALYLAGFRGYRSFILYGFDSSYRDGQHHAYAQPLNDRENVVDVTYEGRIFKAAPWMAYQAEEFQHVAASFAEQDCVIRVAGDGLLPWMANRMVHKPKVVTAVYDLAVCPPTYDFISFLGEAERYRLEIGAEAIDIVFMPGPINGFRDDMLPDGHASRVGMLHRVCIGACRLLPSMRNVEVLKRRRKIVGDNIFPVGYLENPRIQRYGSSFFRSAMPVLESTKVARAFVERCHKRRYVTITLRQSSHWPQRNSRVSAWEMAANHIELLGYDVVWVPDIESQKANAYSWDVDLRLALYEGAEVNLGVNNGPMCMLFYSDARYIIFKMVTDGIPWCMPDYFANIGMLDGPVQGGKGRLIWGDDTLQTIVGAFGEFISRGREDVAA